MLYVMYLLLKNLSYNFFFNYLYGNNFKSFPILLESAFDMIANFFS